ncbi:MAG: tetratricopeptide repeat protein, partial [Spongiibacteraceae bacterium]|nr:tetratricopeptide repeat protein [Spongiibacteraceae bacterium]
EDVLREKEQYIENYGFSSEFWLQKNESARNFIRPFVKKYLPELARYHHARAQANANVNTRKLSKKKRTELQLAIKAGFVKAGDYYQEFIDTFPVDDQVPEIQFLMAESRFEAGNLEAAIDAYEVVAYRYSNNKRGPEAGYSAIVSYEALLKNLNQSKPVDTDTQETWLRLKIESQLRFSDTFVDDKRSDAVLVKSSEELLELAEYRQARDAAQKLIRKEPVAKKAFRKTAWLVIGHSQFELESYNNAEQAYQKTLELLSAKDPKRKAIKERLAASVYKQGEQALAGGFTLDAADQFLRVATVAPGSAISITAQFDAANALLASSSWVAAIDVLDKFQRNYPNNKLSKDVPAKLVVAYQGSGQWSKAAAQLTSIYNGSSDDAVKRESLYQAAEYYEKAGDISSAIDRYRSYAHTYPEPFPVAMEARFKLSEFYLAQGEGSKRRFWLKKMMAADKNAGTQRNDRSRYLAAFSSNVFANDNYQAFKAIPLKLPLKRSLKRKKKALNKALVSYATLSEYAVQEFSTLASYRIASIYQQLSVDLMASERPRGLDELALEEYAILLEEQAFPFEEKSISIHETNTQRSWQGTYDEWIEQSFSSLKTLLPARYGKNEGGMTFDNEIY